MAATRTTRWYFPWVPLGLVTAILAAVVALFMVEAPNAPQAQAATPQATAGFQTTEKIVLHVALPPTDQRKITGPLCVELVGADGQVLAAEQRTIESLNVASGHRFEFNTPKVAAAKITLRCTFGKEKTETPLTKILLVKAHETAVSTGQEFYAGSTAVMRCEVHGVKSMSETVPLTGSSVAVRFKTNGPEKVRPQDSLAVLTIPVYEGKVGDNGIADVQFKVPALPPGAYKLEVVTKSTLGEEKLEREIKIKTSPKVLLVTDKPLYQPGQLIHIRALALQGFDLSPVAANEIKFEVEDGKGNKVFRRELKTSDYGIASIDFQLADEVNQGEYRIRAVLGDQTADKTVTVKPYVLPKFKTEVKADKRFYLPKETIVADIQADYFFGKPVAGGQVKITASTFDVAFKDFQTVDVKTDAHGHARFEIKLPDYFVGQPLDKGNAIVKLEMKVTDAADHTETIVKTFPVSNQAVNVSLIPEGGRLMPGMENRVFVAAIYPDGSPVAGCKVGLWLGQQAKDKPFEALTTNDAGLAEFKLTPKAEQFRAGEWINRKVEMLGGQVIDVGGQKNLFDLFAEAKDAKGATAKTAIALTSEPFGENVLLRLDKPIYKGGESMNVDIRTSAGLPTVYLDVIRGGQTVLTKWLDVKDGKATQKLDLPPGAFGSLEVHAYQMLVTGEIIRDSRVVYVHNPVDLKIDVKADETEYKPGQKGTIAFQVTDSNGKPTAAALGVIIVDEAVYALQEMQPGLEKVYFTLQEELLKPQAQVLYHPAETVDNLIRQPVLPADKQQIAEVLLTAVKPKVPQRWDVDPAQDRRLKMENIVNQIGWALYNCVINGHTDILVLDAKTKTFTFKPDLLKTLATQGWFGADALNDPMGGKVTLESLAKQEKGFTPERLARTMTMFRMQNLSYAVGNYATINKAKFFKDDKWTLPDTIVTDAAKHHGYDKLWFTDAWGDTVKLVKLDKKWDHQTGHPVFDEYMLVSAGPDGKFGTDDDVKMLPATQWNMASAWWVSDDARHLPVNQQFLGRNRNQWGARGGMQFEGKDFDRAKGAQGGGGGRGGPVFAAQAAFPGALPEKAALMKEDKKADGLGAVKTEGVGAGAAPVQRTREYFPETMLWQPALITDDKGVAKLELNFADSITTWRLTASASSKGGSLGSMTTPLRVFQDFFVDLDLPLALTQNDEVAFPVAVFNYLKDPQTVKIELKQEEWFELVDGLGLSRSLALKPNEVTSVKFRIRAKKIGNFPLTVTAHGTKMSDAVKRAIDVLPDGKKVEQVASDRLSGTVTQTITIPENALADASKLYVKIYPGVFSQLVEGTEGILRMPGGCFEQTSSSAYPNVLVVDYIKKNQLASPAILMKSEQYLNVGYQRLLTFERPGGGFDWWGSGEPLIWLSAYGLQEFNDMAKVYPIDRAIIDRTQAFLLNKQDADGTWSKIGATHGVSIEQMGDPKLLLTSYVTWSLLESGCKDAKLKKSIEYIRDHVKTADNAYILALAANALASWDAQDDSTHEALVKVLRKLEEKKQEKEEWKALCFPANGQSLTYAHGDYLTVETTALAVIAMLKNGQFTNSANKALIYLAKSKDASGTWGSTQATILALKALALASGGTPFKGEAGFAISVNGKEAAKGTVTEKNADVLQLFDLKEHVKPGANTVTIAVKGETNLMYQVVGRHFEPWATKEPAKPMFDVAVNYDRTQLISSDLLKATATIKYNGAAPTSMVMLDLGIPPGFSVDAGDFAELVAAKKVNKFSVTSRQVTLYLGDIKPGEAQSFEYTLKAKYPVKAKTPPTVAYEYYTPANRGTAAPVELTVVEKK